MSAAQFGCKHTFLQRVFERSFLGQSLQRFGQPVVDKNFKKAIYFLQPA